MKKDFFIKSRNDDIRVIYEFSPKILGRGAYGVVFKARLRMPPHTTRVVKLIAKKFVKNPQFLQSEIEITKTLDHPMIVRLYETFEDDKNIYLVMEYIFTHLVTAKEENSLRDWTEEAILTRMTLAKSLRRLLKSSNIYTPKKYLIVT